MEIGEFWEVLLMGVAIGLALGMALRWIGRKLLSRNQGKEEGGDALSDDDIERDSRQ